MLLIKNVILPVKHTENELVLKITKATGISKKEIKALYIKKKSLDARKKPNLFYVYEVAFEMKDEERWFKKNSHRNPQVSKVVDIFYKEPAPINKEIKKPPIVIGFGPAGLMLGYAFAKAGLSPIILERGEDVDKRSRDVQEFWETGILNGESNVQFGEGGAGTFSDGKLNTSIKNRSIIIEYILKLFVEHGAPEEILYDNKPHIGTDKLKTVVKNIREHIIEMGGTVRFGACVTDFIIQNNVISGVVVNHEETIESEQVVLAIGHSARDTIRQLANRGIAMEPKAFAVGLRIIHPQNIMNQAQFGTENSPIDKAAEYKVTYTTKESNRGVYSFCMCPGGYVVNASSQAGKLAVNGMSNYKRDSQCANSALVVTIKPEDYFKNSPLDGMIFQEKLEEVAFDLAKGKIPIQSYESFANHIPTKEPFSYPLCIKGEYEACNLYHAFPTFIMESIREAMEHFGQRINGFDNPEACFAGIESRTSSPIRINRSDDGESNIRGLYPCGEGAGYAGGIMSAACDGLRLSKLIIEKYRDLL